MTIAEILEALPSLTPAERLSVIETILELMRKELPQQTPAMSAGEQRTLARERLLASLNEEESPSLLQKIFRVFTG